MQCTARVVSVGVTASCRRDRNQVVRASAVPDASRRNMLLATVAAPLLFASSRADAIQIFDDRKTKSFMESIDQARDSDEDQYKRFSYRNLNGISADEHKRRVQDSLRRLTSDLKPSIDKQYWPKVEADLRHQLGTLRFDLDALAASKDKAARREAQALQDSVMRSLEELDLATRNRNKEASLRSLTAATDQLSTLIKMLG